WPGFFAGRTEVDRLNDVAREEQFNRPVAHPAHLAFESRELAEIKGAPEKPREKAAEFVTLYFRARGVVADDAERAERIKMEWFQWLASDARAQVAGERARLADRKLRSRRTRLASLCIGHDGAVAQRPKSGVAPHRE